MFLYLHAAPPSIVGLCALQTQPEGPHSHKRMLAGKLSNVVHICSSDSFPVRGKTIHTTIGAYLAEDPVVNPGQTLVRDGNYQVEFVKTRTEFRMRCLWMGLKLRTISALLKMQGRTRQARKVPTQHHWPYA